MEMGNDIHQSSSQDNNPFNNYNQFNQFFQDYDLYRTHSSEPMLLKHKFQGSLSQPITSIQDYLKGYRESDVANNSTYTSYQSLDGENNNLFQQHSPKINSQYYQQIQHSNSIQQTNFQNKLQNYFNKEQEQIQTVPHSVQYFHNFNNHGSPNLLERRQSFTNNDFDLSVQRNQLPQLSMLYENSQNSTDHILNSSSQLDQNNDHSVNRVTRAVSLPNLEDQEKLQKALQQQQEQQIAARRSRQMQQSNVKKVQSNRSSTSSSPVRNGKGASGVRKNSQGLLEGQQRRCVNCGATKTPQWRGGPQGQKSLCNACGVRYKSGRLKPQNAFPQVEILKSTRKVKSAGNSPKVADHTEQHGFNFQISNSQNQTRASFSIPGLPPAPQYKGKNSSQKPELLSKEVGKLDSDKEDSQLPISFNTDQDISDDHNDLDLPISYDAAT